MSSSSRGGGRPNPTSTSSAGTPGTSTAGATAAAAAAAGLLGRSVASTAPGRLPSLRASRDLTLGGGRASLPSSLAAPLSVSTSASALSAATSSSSSLAAAAAASNRRTFVPNLGAAKKDPSAASKDIKDEKQNGSGGKDSAKSKKAGASSAAAGSSGKSEDFGGRHRGGGHFVQTHSIFAEGLGGVVDQQRGSAAGSRRGGGGGGGGRGRGGDDATDSVVKIEPAPVEVRQKAERGAAAAGFFIADLRQGDSHPVRLPMPLTDSSTQLQRKLLVKEEPMDVDDSKEAVTTATAAAAATASPAELIEACALSGEFFSLQLPALLPLPPGGKRQHRGGAVGDSAARGLETWPEGRIGTLQVLDTGEVRLLLNSQGDSEPVAFTVSLGADVAHLQELVLLRQQPPAVTDSAEGEQQAPPPPSNKAEMLRLGRIDKRLICSPDIDSLLDNSASQTPLGGLSGSSGV